jgi:hypothetical protein
MSLGRKQGKIENLIGTDEEWPKDLAKLKSKIMYIEDKSLGITGSARIARVYFSRSGKTLYYQNRRFRSLDGTGFKANYFDVDSSDQFWISGPKKDKNDRLYGGNKGVVVDDDVVLEYENYLKG